MSNARTVRAAVLHGARSIAIENLALPAAEVDTGVLRVEASGVCGADWTPYIGATSSALSFRPPLILGHEIIGVVEEIGPEAEARWGVTQGDRVVVEEAIPCGACRSCLVGRYMMCRADRYGCRPLVVAPGLWGGYAEYIYLDPRSILHEVSKDLPTVLGPMFVPVSNGLYWVQELGGCLAGSTVVIQGPGQHGLGCVIGAREAGAGKIIMTGISGVDEARLEVAKELGADEVILADLEGEVTRVDELTDGQLADVVIHAADRAPRAFEASVELAGDRATIVNVGHMGGSPPDRFNPDLIVTRELTIKGARGRYGRSIRAALNIIESGRYPLDLLATHTFPLEETDRALRTVGRELGKDAIHVTVMAS